MANKHSGVVEKITRSRKAFKLVGEDDEVWYSAFKPAQMEGVEEGSSVEFEYATKNQGGKTYYNIQGNVKVTGSAPAASGGGGGRSPSQKDTTITRLSLVKTAAEIVSMTGNAAGGSIEDVADDVIAVAQRLEEYVNAPFEE